MEEIFEPAATAHPAAGPAVTHSEIDDSWFAGAAAGTLQEPDEHPSSRGAPIGSATLARHPRTDRRGATPTRTTRARRARTSERGKARMGGARLAGVGALLLALVVVVALTANPPHATPQPDRAVRHAPRTPPTDASPAPAPARETTGHPPEPITRPSQPAPRRATPTGRRPFGPAALPTPAPPRVVAARPANATPATAPVPAPGGGGRVAPLPAGQPAGPRAGRDPSFTPGDLPPASSTR